MPRPKKLAARRHKEHQAILGEDCFFTVDDRAIENEMAQGDDEREQFAGDGGGIDRVCIEFWKIGKAMRIEVDRSGMVPRLRFHDRESYSSNKTKEYNDIAIKFLSYVLLLLVIGLSIYSLAYECHKSWYSWILSSLTSCVYMFGFIMMCPQLFINYKLKSVAHLPLRQMTYKFLNTIIDDLFAFVIKMPILHRLSVFRDDVIFLIYLYQRWVYPVDKTHVNEFGFGGEDETA